MNTAILMQYGIDYDAGVRRFMDDRELYEEMLNAFVTDSSFGQAQEAFDRRDYCSLFEQAHALKGVAGNMDMLELYRSSSELTEYLRNNDRPERERVSELFGKMRTAHARVIDGINTAGSQL